MTIFNPTEIPDVVLVEPRVFRDHRGFFMEVHNQRVFADAGISVIFVQDNHSLSFRSVLRGMHYQMGRPQGKLVRAVRGEIFDVAVDMRASSPSFGRWVGSVLSADNRRQLWIPPGFAHGFLTLSPEAEVAYKCTDFHAPADERCLAWNDPDVGIEWPLDGAAPILSAKDAAGRAFAECERYA